jgi:hypothetical protein
MVEVMVNGVVLVPKYEYGFPFTYINADVLPLT